MSNIITTPAGKFVYPYLTQPDTIDPNKPKFKVKMNFPTDSQAWADFVKQCADLYDEVLADAKKASRGKPVKAADFPIKDLDDGTSQFTATLNASGVNSKTGVGFTQKPVVKDSKNQDWDTSVNVTNGSTGRLRVEVYPFYSPAKGHGIAFRLKAAQVHTLAEVVSQADDGFDAILDDDIPVSAPKGQGYGSADF